MTIRSNPPGAYVYIDNYPIGVTPVGTDFVYYGKRQFRLVRDGYETLTVDQKVRAPWYQWFGIDFISENLIPYNIRDEQTLNFQMVPQQIPPIPELTARAKNCGPRRRPSAYAAPVPPPGAVVAPPAGAPGVMAAPPAGAPMVLPPPSAGPPVAVPPAGPAGSRVPPPGTGQSIYTMPPPTAPPLIAPPPAFSPPQGQAPAGQIPPPQQLSL